MIALPQNVPEKMAVDITCLLCGLQEFAMQGKVQPGILLTEKDFAWPQTIVTFNNLQWPASVAQVSRRLKSSTPLISLPS